MQPSEYRSAFSHLLLENKLHLGLIEPASTSNIPRLHKEKGPGDLCPEEDSNLNLPFILHD
jgi:hypothetical protein